MLSQCDGAHRVLATRFGTAAVDLIREGGWGNLVRLKNGSITHCPLEQVAGAPRHIDPQHELIAAAQAVGIELGV